jgi:hypothetical protein
MPRTAPAGVVTVPTGPLIGPSGELRTIPEFFYREAVPPPEVLQPPAPAEPPTIFNPVSPPA